MTYEYKCKKCKHLWEEDQSIKDKPIEVCPKCKKKGATRLISGGSSFILKGGNWSNNGYSG